MNKTDTQYDNRTSHNTVALLRFSAADEDWAMAYSDIKAVITARDITPVPKTPSFVAGIVHNQGMIITAFDLAVLLGQMPPIAMEARYFTSCTTPWKWECWYEQNFFLFHYLLPQWNRRNKTGFAKQ